MEYATGRRNGKMIYEEVFEGSVKIGAFGSAFVTLIPAGGFTMAWITRSWIDLQTSGGFNLPVSIGSGRIYVSRDGSGGPLQLKVENLTAGEIVNYYVVLEYVQ